MLRYRNNRDGTFTDVGKAAGVNDRFQSHGAAWADFNGDGHPDIYVANFNEKNRLYQNNGDGTGTFTDVATMAGVATGHTIKGFGLVWGDYDSDGKIDL